MGGFAVPKALLSTKIVVVLACFEMCYFVGFHRESARAQDFWHESASYLPRSSLPGLKTSLNEQEWHGVDTQRHGSRHPFVVNMKNTNPFCPDDNAKLLHLAETEHTYYSLEDLFEGRSIYSTNNETATCRFNHAHRYSSHFPHTMQQLYRCLSWWNANNGTKVLLDPPSGASPFVAGALDLFRNMGVTLTKNATGLAPVQVKDDVDFNWIGYRLHSPNDMARLRESAANHMGLHYESCNDKQPRVTILNRSVRKLKNATKWQSLLTSALRVPVNLIDSMDGLTFEEQVQIMADTDILISPHGAQLTSLPFLPRCAHVYEIFPVGYLLPEYFGSLAAASGHTHHYIYPTTEEPEMETQELRNRARRRRVCVSDAAIHEHILPGIVDQVEKWRSCCDDGDVRQL